ncbi:MAG: tRNA (adenosine(37)-N6)-threonylcarbamoyltransferase complex ATPase subunit type 1 TsaE [Candidatus Gracilibacteria bacterium]
MSEIYSINNINNVKITIKEPSLIFLRGDLGAGKTTLTKHIINNLLEKKCDVTSPTYTYYNKIDNIYHFDLYRLKSYDEFFAIGGEDILDNNEGVIILEWPDIIEKYYTPDIEILLKKTDNESEREIIIKYNT